MKTSKLDIVRTMPPLHHTIPGEPFRMEDSEVVKWLLRQPDVMVYLFEKAKPLMVYDKVTNTWRGAEYH